MNVDTSQSQDRSLHSRTKAFALRVIRLYSAIANDVAAQVLGKQLLRSGTSVGAHYAEGSRARSAAEFISKLEVAIQEMEETRYWLDLLVEGGFIRAGLLEDLRREADELTAMLVASVRKVKRNRNES